MKIIFDEREHSLYEKSSFIHSMEENKTISKEIEMSKKVLPLGDVLIQTNDDNDILLIERKSLSDLMSSIRDGRYEELSYRLLYSHEINVPSHNIIYLVEGMLSHFKDKERKKIYSAMTSLLLFKGFSVIRTVNIKESAEWIFWTTDKIRRDFIKKKHFAFSKTLKNSLLLQSQEPLQEPPQQEPPQEPPLQQEPQLQQEPPQEPPQQQQEEKTEYQNIPSYCNVVKKVKKENITKENIGEIILCQIPNVSSVSAVAIMKHFTSFPEFMKQLQENPSCLNGIQIESNGKKRKLNKNIIENISRFLL